MNMLKKISESAMSMATLHGELTRLNAEVETLRQLLQTAEATIGVRIDVEVRSLVESMLRQRRAVVVPSAATRDPVDLAASSDAPTLEEAFALLAREAPAATALWRELLEVNARTYEGFPVHSCSVGGHEMAELFACFLRPYLTGTVLDVGCGPQPVPVYLDGHPVELIAGIDPLAPAEAHPFAFAQAVCEHLPWPADTFDLVVVGTSLDHVLLLDRALAEMHRVLAPGGHLAIWVSFVEGSAPYDPYRDDIEAIDEYHLFHFDRPWFEDLLRSRFVVREIIPFGRGAGSFFYAFQRV